MVYNLLQIIMLNKFATSFRLNAINANKQSLINRTKAQQFATQIQSEKPFSAAQSSTTDVYVQRILRKSQNGRALAKQVTTPQTINKFEREQRYEIFINKMKQLYTTRKAWKRKLAASTKRMRSALLLYQQPVQQVLSEYSKMTTNGFNEELLVAFLENLNGVIQARGNKPRVYTDYTIGEMDQSWRMEKVAEDIKFGLTNDFVFFSPHNMGRSSRELGELGYKNTEIISTWLNTLQEKLVQGRNIKISENPNFESVVYGSMKNFKPSYYVFQGFQSDKEFEEHVQTLLMFKSEEKKKEQIQFAPDTDAYIEMKQAQQIEEQLEQLIEASKAVKTLQIDQQAAIDNLRQQYFKLQQAQSKHDFLQENKYIVYDMLELQELLVKGGYLNPDEALFGVKESIEDRMERASNVFYDFVTNNIPEFMSPQYNQIYQAAEEQNKVQTPDVTEQHNDLSLGPLSDILVGLAEQAQSQRRDAKDKDYPNKFYEQLLMPEESRIGNKGVSREEQMMQKLQTPYVLMEQSYLNAWRNFAKESDKIVKQHFGKLIAEEKSAEGLLKGLRGLSACKQEQRKDRDLIHKALKEKLNTTKNLQKQAGIDGLVGIGNCAYTPKGTDALIHQIADQIAKSNFSYYQRFDLLNGMALCASKDQTILDHKLFARVMKEVDALAYEAIDNDLTYKQYMQLYDVHMTCKFYNRPSFQNKMLSSALEQKQHFISRYDEGRTESYDPLKDKVTAGLVRGISDADLGLIQDQQNFNDFVGNLTLKPDILTGYKGDQLAIYVLNARQTMQDTKSADGRTTHLMSLAHNVKPVAVPLDRIVDYDLQTFKLKIRDDFEINSLLDTKSVQNLPYQRFAKFASRLAGKITDATISSNFDGFVNQLAEFFTLKSRLEFLHEPEQLLAANDELKLSLIKLSLIHEKLSPQEQVLVQTSTGSSFNQVVDDLRQNINEQHTILETKKLSDNADSKFDLNWVGVRQSVELPLQNTNHKKQIAPELISQKFLTHGSYHHYDDWKKLMQDTYDQFNLMELSEPGVKINYDAAYHDRRVPKGIYPLPNSKREVMQQPGGMKELPSQTDRFTKFEADPHKYMIKQELELAKTLKPLTPEVSMITNLQNIKYALLADYSNEQICQKLLEFTFTDELIDHHLGTTKQIEIENLLPRDPAQFRKYMDLNVNQQSAFNQFFLQEGLKQVRVKEIYNEVVEKQRKFEAEGLQELNDELTSILMKNEKENEDLFNLSSSFAQYVNVKVDLKSLGVLDQSLSNKYHNNSLNDAEYLNRERCLAESRLIKTKIIYKIDQKIQLSKSEKSYLKAWRKSMKKNSTLIDDCLVPSEPCGLKINNLSTSEFDVLNSLPRVNITSQEHGQFALSDLILELGQVFDNQTVRAVELTCLQETFKKDWQLGKNFKLFTKRNKEIDIVLNKFEEIAYRSSGQFTDSDYNSIKEMFLVGRGMDTYDRAYLDKDIKSLEQFIADSNPYDNRIQMLEVWLARKEQEIKSRVNMPTPEMAQSDKTIYTALEKTYKPAREQLVSKILAQDGKSTQDYQNLTSKDLHQFVEALCPRLNLFNKEYPVFLPHAVRAVMEHKNLTKSDRATLDAFCKIFQLDWRGDFTIENKDQFMATHPIYLNDNDQTSLNLVGNITNQRVTKELREACQPYLPDLANKIMGTI